MRVFQTKLLQAATSIVLLVGLSIFVDWRSVFSNMQQAAPVWLVLAAASIILARLTITWRWMILLELSGRVTRWWQLFGIVSAGIGIGSLLPTSLGPDVMRGALLARHEQAESGSAQLTSVVSSLLLDRLAALLGTLVVAMAAAAASGLWSLALPFAALFVAVLLAVWIGIRRGPGIVNAVAPRQFGKLRDQLQMLLLRLRDPDFVRRSLTAAIAVSILMTLARTLVFFCLYHAFDYSVPIGHALVMIPLLLIALVIPISIGGFGLREWVLVVGFQGLGVPASVSVSVGILSFALQLVVSAPWILSHIFGWFVPRSATAIREVPEK